MANADPHFKVRVPPDLRAEIERAARENERTMNSEIVFRLRQHQKSASAPTA